MAYSVEDLVRHWERFAHELEEGFADGIDDYQFYLDVRDGLRRRIEAKEVDGLTEGRVASVDRRVLASTRPSSKSTAVFAVGCAPFNHRIPLKLRPELYEDLRARGADV